MNGRGLGCRQASWCWLVSCLMLGLVCIGCGTSPSSSADRVDYHFSRGEFQEALAAVDQELTKSPTPERRAELETMRGRCFWELTAQTSQADEVDRLLRSAVEALTRSISTFDNAEARHLRSLVFDELGEDERAAVDQAEWRKLDATYRSAYLNERPEEILLLTETDRTSADRSEATQPSGSDSLAPRADDLSFGDENPEDAVATEQRFGSAVLSAPTADDSSSDSPTSQAGRRSSGRPSQADREGGESSGRAETRSSGEDPASTAGDDKPAEPTAASRSPQLPGSTWQPISPFGSVDPPDSESGSTDWPSAVPTTGITGPSAPAIPAPAIPSGPRGAPSSSWATAPTTGITGPPGAASGLVSPSAPFGMPSAGMPSTGIGAQPSAPNYSAGLPGPFAPFDRNSGLSAMPRLPYTGALPASAQQGLPGSQLGNLSTQGPNYSPLRPSPLTAPQGPALGLQSGVPNLSTSPLRWPTPNKPVRPTSSLPNVPGAGSVAAPR